MWSIKTYSNCCIRLSSARSVPSTYSEPGPLMARYLITEIIRTACASPGSRTRSRGSHVSHVSSVVLDRGGAYLVTDIYDFMEHGHSFVADQSSFVADQRSADQLEPVTRTRCRHCGRPTLRITVAPAASSGIQHMDAMSTG